MNKITIYTDAGVQHLGTSAHSLTVAFSHIKGLTKDFEIACRLEGGIPYSHGGELMAVWMALNSVPNNQYLQIYSDNKAVVDICRTLWKKHFQQLPAAEFMRYSDSNLLYIIHYYLSQHAENALILFDWVKAHNGDPGNERADELTNIAHAFKPIYFIPATNTNFDLQITLSLNRMLVAEKLQCIMQDIEWSWQTEE